MKKQKFLSLALVCLAASCAPGSNTGDSQAVASTSTGTNNSNETIVVPFWHTFGQKVKKAVDAKAEQFEKLILDNTGVKVKIDVQNTTGTTYDTIHDNIEKSFSTNATPSLAIAYPDHVADYLAADSSYVYDISSFVNDSEIGFGKQSYLGDSASYGASDFVSSFWAEGTTYPQEGRYSIPFLKSSEAMIYNREAVLKGFSYFDSSVATAQEAEDALSSMSWSRFMEFCQSIYEHKADIMPDMKSVAFYDSDSNLFISKLYQEEIPYAHAENGKGVIDFESGEARTKAESLVSTLRDEYDAHLLTTKAIEGTYGSSGFKNMEYVFCIGSTGGTGYSIPTSTETFHVDAVTVPSSSSNEDNDSLYISQGPTLAILRNPSLSKEENDKRARYAFQFAKFLTNPDNNVEMAFNSEGYIPVRKSAYATKNYLAYLADDTDTTVRIAKLLTNDIQGKYIVQDVFKGSAALRTAVGGIMADVCIGSRVNVSTELSNVINAAKAKM